MHLDPHPFLQNNTGSIISLPPQLIPLSDKDEDWEKACMDGLEAIGMRQFWLNQKLRENYRMVRGEFLRWQYEDVDTNEYVSLVQMAQESFQKEMRLHHFDFIKQVINTLVGELEGHPDTYRVKAEGDVVNGARIREKSRLLKEYINQQIEEEINQGLIDQGLEPDKADFTSDEEKQQYDEQLAQAKQALTPESIQKYMSTEWSHIAEKWGNIQLEQTKKLHDLRRKMSVEFEDYLTSESCFRHYYLNGLGYTQESWNPIECFYPYDADQSDIEKRDYIGRTYKQTLAQVIDRFGDKMTGDELERLYGKVGKYSKGDYKKDAHGNPITYTDFNGNPYGQRVPWQNENFKYLPQVSQSTSVNFNTDPLFDSRVPYEYRMTGISGEYQVTEAYWKSQKKIGRLTWLNPETGVIEKVIVDETIVLPPKTKVKEGNLSSKDVDEDSAFSEKAFQPTIEWTWINEVWGGVKLFPLGSHSTSVEINAKPIYINVKPLPFQGKPDAFVYDAELPVVGLAPNTRNGPSQALVDLLKPFQIAVNLYMNQAYKMAEEDILPFLLMDNNAIPKTKDWSGPDGFVKWMESIRSLQIGITDTRPANLMGANSGGQLPKVVDLDTTQRAMAKYQMAQMARQMALEQVGMSNQRMGDINSQETATGVKTAVARSFVQTAPIFSRFDNYWQRTLKKSLDFAQFVQATDRDLIAATTNSDFSSAWLKLNGTDLLSIQLNVFVTNSQQDIRDLEISRQLALENNTSELTAEDRFVMATGKSRTEIKDMLHNATLESQKQQQIKQQQEQAKLDAAQKLQDETHAYLIEKDRLDRLNDKEIAYIRTFSGKNNTTTSDVNDNGTFDVLEYEKLSQAGQGLSQKAETDRQKQELARLKLLAESDQHEDYLQEQAKERASREKIAQLKISQAKILGDKRN